MRAVFLDIDGVLLPCVDESQRRYLQHKTDGSFSDLVSDLKGKGLFTDRLESLLERNQDLENTLLAVQWDFDSQSVKNVKELIKASGAGVVISSSWRSYGSAFLRAALGVHDLDQYLMGTTPYRFNYFDEEEGNLLDDKALALRTEVIDRIGKVLAGSLGFDLVSERSVEICSYLLAHRDIDSFVVLDNENLRNAFKDHFVLVPNFFTGECLVQALKLIFKPIDRALITYLDEGLIKKNEMLNAIFDDFIKKSLASTAEAGRQAS